MNSRTKECILVSVLLAIGIMTALTMVSCGPDKTSQGNVIPNTERTPRLILDFFLDDGTRCVFAKSGYGGGLSCDFDANRRRAE